MVTQRRMNSLKRSLNAVVKEVADLLNEKGEIKEENVGVFTEEQFQKYCEEFEGFEETLEENEENGKF